jgi:hypothetical protein
MRRRGLGTHPQKHSVQVERGRLWVAWGDKSKMPLRSQTKKDQAGTSSYPASWTERVKHPKKTLLCLAG